MLQVERILHSMEQEVWSLAEDVVWLPRSKYWLRSIVGTSSRAARLL